MAVDAPKQWGESIHRYIWAGHVHHDQKLDKKDFPGVEAETFSVLPPGDAWHHSKGYRAKREMKSIIMHRKHGEIGRNSFKPEMLS